jgi:hypothetical protein
MSDHPAALVTYTPENRLAANLPSGAKPLINGRPSKRVKLRRLSGRVEG